MGSWGGPRYMSVAPRGPTTWLATCFSQVAAARPEEHSGEVRWEGGRAGEEGENMIERTGEESRVGGRRGQARRGEAGRGEERRGKGRRGLPDHTELPRRAIVLEHRTIGHMMSTAREPRNDIADPFRRHMASKRVLLLGYFSSQSSLYHL